MIGYYYYVYLRARSKGYYRPVLLLSPMKYVKQDKGRSVLPFSRTNEAAVHRRCSIELTWFCFGSVNPFRNSTRSDDGLLASPFPINHSIRCEYYQPYARFLG